MENIDLVKAAQLQQDCAAAYALARNTYDTAKTAADLDLAATRQQAAAVSYRSAVAAREVALGI